MSPGINLYKSAKNKKFKKLLTFFVHECIITISKPVIKSSSCHFSVAESRRCCECDTDISVNGLMRADESCFASSYRRGVTPLSVTVVYKCDVEWMLCINMGGTAGFQSCPK